MKTYENRELFPTDTIQKNNTSSQAVSHAPIYRSPEKERGWLVSDPASGLSSPELLASYVTSNLSYSSRTSDGSFQDQQLHGSVNADMSETGKKKKKSIARENYEQFIIARHAKGIWASPQRSILENTGLTEFSEIWPRSGVMLNGIAYRLGVMSDLMVQPNSAPERHISGIESGSSHDQKMWRSPAAQEPGVSIERLRTKDGGKPKPNVRLYDKKNGRLAQIGLGQEVKMWPTPKASISGPDYARSNRPESGGDDLATAVARRETLLPTPRAADGPKPPMGKNRLDSLPLAVKLWPTPISSDYKGSVTGDKLAERQDMARGVKLSEQVSREGDTDGQLSPTWELWLMKLPLDFLDLDGYQNPELAELPEQYLTVSKK